MKIVVVIDIFDMQNNANGTVMTAYRFVNALKARGHTVRVVASGATGEDCYEVPERYLPLATEFARPQQIRFAKPVVETLVNAFQGADIVHFYLPFYLEKKGRKIAQQMGIPCTGAFHLQPENVTYNCGMGWCQPLNSALYAGYRSRFYKHFGHIHCPSLFIANQLRKHRYKAKLHVISNGVESCFCPPETKLQPLGDDINILMIGRYAHEKRQDVLIKAIALSKYADRIHLTLAGHGPCTAKLEKLAAKYLHNPTTFGFFKKDELIKVIHASTLYVHAADIEIEAISCIEAFACGLVPVIANSKKSATPQFALDERSLFKAGSAKELAKKIDYWLDNPEERERMESEYALAGKRYSLDYSIDKTEEMFREAIADHHTLAALDKKKRSAERKKFGKKNWFFRMCSWILYYFLVVPLLFITVKITNGIKIKGRKNLRKIRKTGAVSISNHVYLLDVAFNASALHPRHVICTALESNFKIPYGGVWLKLMGAVPVPDDIHELPAFFRETHKALKRRRVLHFYPEGHLINYYAGLRDFNRGAFLIACDAQVPVLPIVISWRKRRGLYRLFYPTRPCATVTICPPETPNYILMKREMETELMERCKASMQRIYDSNQDQNIDYFQETGTTPQEHKTKAERMASMPNSLVADTGKRLSKKERRRIAKEAAEIQSAESSEPADTTV